MNLARSLAHWPCAVALAAAISATGCSAVPEAPPQPWPERVEWKSVEVDALYAECIKALHLQGYELLPEKTSKESGLIVTQLRDLTFPDVFRSGCSLSLLVTRAGDSTLLSIQARGRYERIVDSYINSDPTPNRGAAPKRYAGAYAIDKTRVNDQVASDVAAILSHLEDALGPPSSVKSATLAWRKR